MTNIDLVRGFYAAAASGDIGGVVSSMADQIAWHEAENFPYADGNPYIGPDAVLQGVFARLGADWDDFVVEVGELLEAGDRVVMLGRYKGVYRKTGKPIHAQVVHVWTLADGKLTAFQQYADTLQIARAQQP